MIKPIRGTTINWSRPLARGLVGCLPFNEIQGDTVFNQARHDLKFLLENGATWDSLGGVYCPTGGSSQKRIRSSVLAKDFNIAAEGTLVVGYARKGSWGNYGPIYNVENTSNNSGNEMGFWNQEGTGLWFFPNYSQSSGTRWEFGDTPNNLFTLYKPYNIAVSWKQSDSSLAGYINGVLTGSKTGTTWTLNDWSATNSYVFLGGSIAGTTETCNGVVLYALLYNRKLTAIEIMQLQINPYILFERQAPAPWLYAAAGGITVSLSDAITVAENVSNNLITVRLKVSVSDAINITEFTKEPITPLIIRLNEAITVLENLKAVVNPLTISGIETIAVIDNAIVSLNTVRLNITASDAISVVESVSAELSGITGLTKSVNEAISAIENITVSLLTIRYKVSVSEAVSVLENLTAQLIYTLYKVSVFDSITVSENIAVLLTGGFEAKPYNIMSFAIDNDISKSISFQGNILPISITTGTPTAAPPGGKGVVFKVLGGVVTIFVWDSNTLDWVAK